MRCMEARLPPAKAGATKVLILSPGLARPGAQAQVPVNQLGQAEIQGQGGWQDQLSIGHQAVVVSGGRQRRRECGRGGCVVAFLGYS